MANVNGEPSMAPTKKPGKLNTSFWEQQAASKGGDSKPKKRKSSPRKKKRKSQMASMWEDKLAKQKKEVEATAVPSKPSAAAAAAAADSDAPKPTITEKPAAADSGATTASASDAPTPEPEPESEPATKAASADSSPAAGAKKSSVSALAGKLNISPMMMGMRGGLPPSLRKKREERKEDGGGLSEPDFVRPVIPASTRRPKDATKKNIIDVTNDEMKSSLRAYLSENFQFDETMIVSADNLCRHLRDVAGIDLGAVGDDRWELELLVDAAKEVFGDRAQIQWGYQLRAL